MRPTPLIINVLAPLVEYIFNNNSTSDNFRKHITIRPILQRSKHWNAKT